MKDEHFRRSFISSVKPNVKKMHRPEINHWQEAALAYSIESSLNIQSAMSSTPSLWSIQRQKVKKASAKQNFNSLFNLVINLIAFHYFLGMLSWFNRHTSRSYAIRLGRCFALHGNGGFDYLIHLLIHSTHRGASRMHFSDGGRPTKSAKPLSSRRH